MKMRHNVPHCKETDNYIEELRKRKVVLSHLNQCMIHGWKNSIMRAITIWNEGLIIIGRPIFWLISLARDDI